MKGKERPPVHALARVTSKGQVTIPKAVRDALGVAEGDSLHFRVEKGVAEVARVPNFHDLAGSVPVPEELRDVPWSEITRRAWEAQARKNA